MSAQLEQWRVSTVNGVLETDLETLQRWIAEGSVAPTDKVSKGKLNWIDAGRAPMLKAAFQGERVAPAPQTLVDDTRAEPVWQEAPPSQAESSDSDDAFPVDVFRRIPKPSTHAR